MPRLDDIAVEEGLQRLPGWERRANEIVRTFVGADFAHAMVFVDEVAAAAAAAGDHPDIDIRWNKVKLALSTHSEGGLTINDFALAAEREQGANFSPEKVIYEACVARFRPIMMTTFAALAGALPIALGIGAGAESRRPLGLAVVGGLVVSQLLTLYLTPVLYIYMERFKGLFRSRSAPRSDSTAIAKAKPSHA